MNKWMDDLNRPGTEAIVNTFHHTLRKRFRWFKHSICLLYKQQNIWLNQAKVLINFTKPFEQISDLVNSTEYFNRASLILTINGHTYSYYQQSKVKAINIRSKPAHFLAVIMSLKYATVAKNEKRKKKNKRTRPNILGRNIVVCIPDSNLQKFRPPNTCATHPIPTLKTWKIHKQLPKFGTQNFMMGYSCMFPWQQPTKISTPPYMRNPSHWTLKICKIHGQLPKFGT